MSRNLILPIALLGGLGLIGTLIFLGVHTTDHKGYITEKYWERTQEVEEFDWVHHSDSGDFNYPSIPHGARSVKQWTEVSMESDEDGNTWTDTDYFVSYDVREWTFSRSVVTNGTHKQEPDWPRPVLAQNPPERLSRRYEKFSAEFMVTVGPKVVKKTYSTRDSSTYFDMKLDYPYSCEVNGFGKLVRIKEVSGWSY